MSHLSGYKAIPHAMLKELHDERDSSRKRIAELDDALEDMVLAMEAWGREGDGIPEEGPIADAYDKARKLLKGGEE